MRTLGKMVKEGMEKESVLGISAATAFLLPTLAYMAADSVARRGVKAAKKPLVGPMGWDLSSRGARNRAVASKMLKNRGLSGSGVRRFWRTWDERMG